MTGTELSLALQNVQSDCFGVFAKAALTLWCASRRPFGSDWDEVPGLGQQKPRELHFTPLNSREAWFMSRPDSLSIRKTYSWLASLLSSSLISSNQIILVTEQRRPLLLPLCLSAWSSDGLRSPCHCGFSRHNEHRLQPETVRLPGALSFALSWFRCETACHRIKCSFECCHTANSIMWSLNQLCMLFARGSRTPIFGMPHSAVPR